MAGAFLAVFLTVGCTEAARTKRWGGTMTIQVPNGQKFIEATWKEGGNVWYTTRAMRTNEEPETFYFREKSQFGAFEGTIVFQESR